MLQEKFSIAPMMAITNRHQRYLYRLISKQVWLYTEMIVDRALVFGNSDNILQFSAVEKPLVLQLGGCTPSHLQKAIKKAQPYQFTEINLNVGCPSQRVEKGNFGVTLMRTPNLVFTAVKTMQENTDSPITVKTRIGVDEFDSYEYLAEFIAGLDKHGIKKIIIHARKAILGSFSPRKNLNIPKLDYEKVYKIKQQFPHLKIIINGGIATLDQASQHFNHAMDGVMLGRVARDNPWIIAEIDAYLHEKFNDSYILDKNNSTKIPIANNLAQKIRTITERKSKTRKIVISKYLDYIERELSKNTHLNILVNPLLNLYKAQPNGALWRKELSQIIQGGTHHTDDKKLAITKIYRLLNSMNVIPESNFVVS